MCNKAKKQLEAAKNKESDAEKALEAAHESLRKLKEERFAKEAALEKATSALNDLCAAQLRSADSCLMPSQACLSDGNFRRKFEEIRALEKEINKAAEPPPDSTVPLLTQGSQPAPSEFDEVILQATADFMGSIPEGEEESRREAYNEIISAFGASLKKAKARSRSTPYAVAAASGDGAGSAAQPTR